MSLADLMSAGLLVKGKGAVSTSYKGITYLGDVGPSAIIHWNGLFFQNVSAWTLAVKR